MSNQEFENYVALIGKLLQLTREQRDLISGELQDHLQMRVADLVSDGVAKQDAVARALEEFGDAAVMARNFQTVINLKRRRWMMRFATISIAGAFLAAVLTMALWPDNARFGTPNFSLAQETEAAQTDALEIASINLRLSDATQRNLKTEEALKQVVDLEYNETPFGEVMDELAELTGLNFLLDNSAKDDSLMEDEPLTFKINKLPLNKSLELMLVEKNATYFIDEGVVVFISKDDAEDAQYMRLKMFDCRDLVTVLPESFPIYQDSGNGLGFGGGGGGGMFCISQGLGMTLPSDDPATEKPQEAGDETDESDSTAKAPAHSKPKPVASRDATLLNLVFSMVDPDSWELNGGMATAQIVNGILIVRQTESAFRKIENLLMDLHANVFADGKAGKASPRKPRETKRVRPKLPKDSVSHDDPFGGSKKKNPFGDTSAKDPISSSESPFSSRNLQTTNDPFGN